MSWWNPIDDIKSVGHAIGSVASNPVMQGLAGLGNSAMGGAITGGIGGLLKPGGGGKAAVAGAGKGAVIGGATGMAAGALGLGGEALAGAIPGIASAVPSIGPAIAKFASEHGVDAAKALLAKVPGLQGASDFLGGNGGTNALAAAQAANAALLSKKSSDYATNAMGSTQANWDERAPLRTAGQAGMLNPGAGIAPKISGIPNRNIYSAGPPQIGRAV